MPQSRLRPFPSQGSACPAPVAASGAGWGCGDPPRPPRLPPPGPRPLRPPEVTAGPRRGGGGGGGAEVGCAAPAPPHPTPGSPGTAGGSLAPAPPSAPDAAAPLALAGVPQRPASQGGPASAAADPPPDSGPSPSCGTRGTPGARLSSNSPERWARNRCGSSERTATCPRRAHGQGWGILTGNPNHRAGPWWGAGRCARVAGRDGITKPGVQIHSGWESHSGPGAPRRTGGRLGRCAYAAETLCACCPPWVCTELGVVEVQSGRKEVEKMIKKQPKKWGLAEGAGMQTHGVGAGSQGMEGNSKGGAGSPVRCWPEHWLDRNWECPRPFVGLTIENLGEIVP